MPTIRVLLLFLCTLFTKNLISQKTILIQNVIIVDGDAKPAYSASVLIQNSKIIGIGALETNAQVDQVIDGKGKILAPGFIQWTALLSGCKQILLCPMWQVIPVNQAYAKLPWGKMICIERQQMLK
jgi:hypothetical protein